MNLDKQNEIKQKLSSFQLKSRANALDSGGYPEQEDIRVNLEKRERAFVSTRLQIDRAKQSAVTEETEENKPLRWTF